MRFEIILSEFTRYRSPYRHDYSVHDLCDFAGFYFGFEELKDIHRSLIV